MVYNKAVKGVLFMKKIVCLVVAVMMLCISLASCERTQQIPLGFYQIDKAQEFSEYSSIGVTLGENGSCWVDFSMTGDSFSGTYDVKQNTLTLSLDTLFGEYISDTNIDIKYIFEISANGSLIFKEYKGDPIKYTYTITGEEMDFKPSLHFEKGSKYILQNEQNNPSFMAKVLEAYDFSILVEPLENEDERKSSDKISVDIPYRINQRGAEFKVNDVVTVVYDGVILETYPAQLGNVFDVKLLD